MKSASLLRQLLWSTLLLLFVLWIIMGTTVAWVVKHEADDIFDSSMEETAQRLLSLAVLQLSPDAHWKPVTTIAAADEDSVEPALHKEYMVYQVFHVSGKLLMRSHAAPMTPLIPDVRPGFQRTPEHLVYTEQSRNGQYLLALAERADHREATLMGMVEFLLLPLLALLPLAAVGMLLIARRARSPLQALASEMARRGSSDLNPVTTEGLPLELQPLATTLNQLMFRLKSALEAERHFAANSAHELRTPLAAAMFQLSVLEGSLTNEQSMQQLETVRQLLQRLHNLTEKLLQLARAESGIAWRRTPVDLTQLVQLICRDHQWRAGMMLEMDLPPAPVMVMGDVDALGIVVNNLLENAIKYATPGSPITIVLTPSPACIRIINDCEALPESAQKRLHERFFRVRPDSRGAGLGLSIVHALVRPTVIELSLSSPAPGHDRGFEARLSWPQEPKD